MKKDLAIAFFSKASIIFFLSLHPIKMIKYIAYDIKMQYQKAQNNK
ncbi:MAG: hypothetical protein LBI45_02295 [Bacteroidales bacterium]|jgi:hypothetical protein|nr:hypothetical protein [Bacteroidales bacterium]